MINVQLMREYGAVERQLDRGEMLVQEGDKAVFYYQILAGEVKMNNYNDEGQETIQGIFKKGESFGEPAVIGAFPFPANAIAVSASKLICLERNRFIDLLKNNPDISFSLLQLLSNRLRFKAIMSKEVKGFEAEHRIMVLLNYIKKRDGEDESPFQITMTRQTIANLTGLRVETVIRTIKKLEKEGKLQIINKKLFL